MLDAVNDLFAIYYAVFQGFCLQYFLGNYLEYRGKKSYLYKVCIVAAYAILSLFIGKLLPYGYGDIRILERQAVIFTMTALLAILFYRVKNAITGYLLITFMTVSQVSFFIAYSVVLPIRSKIFDIWIWCIENGYLAGDGRITTVLHTTTIGLQILLYVICTVLCIASLKRIMFYFREKEYPISRTELCFLFAPSMAGLLICILLRVIILTVEGGTPELLYNQHPILMLVIPVILILCLLSVLYSIKLFQDMLSLNKERNSRVILEQQITSMQEQIAETEHIYSGLRSMKHDMRNTLSVIMQLAGGGDNNTELQAYLSELNQTFDGLEMRYQTGNAVVDTILSMKYHELARTAPAVKLYTDQLLFPDDIRIQSYDIGVMLGNALDNAVEACKKMKGGDYESFIRLSSFSKGKLFFMKVENSFDGNLMQKKGAEFPVTTKPDKKAHGIGLANIKSTAEKYHGAVDWRVDSGIFILTIMLKNERSDEK